MLGFLLQFRLQVGETNELFVENKMGKRHLTFLATLLFLFVNFYIVRKWLFGFYRQIHGKRVCDLRIVTVERSSIEHSNHRASSYPQSPLN